MLSNQTHDLIFNYINKIYRVVTTTLNQIIKIVMVVENLKPLNCDSHNFPNHTHLVYSHVVSSTRARLWMLTQIVWLRCTRLHIKSLHVSHVIWASSAKTIVWITIKRLYVFLYIWKSSTKKR